MSFKIAFYSVGAIMKNVPNGAIKRSDSVVAIMKNEECAKHYNNAQFSILATTRFRFIYQFWKQLTSIPYSLFFAVKKNSFIHSKFHINFFFPFLTKTKQYFSTNHITKLTNLDQSEYDKKFSLFLH